MASFLAVALLATACSAKIPTGQDNIPAADESFPAKVHVDGISEALESDLLAMVSADEIPGAIAIIELDGVRLADVRVGYLDVASGAELPENAIFRLYSMSKPITSAAILMLRDQGKLQLDDPVEKYLPALADMQVFVDGTVDDMELEAAARSITIADLLTHTSGIAYHFTGNTPVHQYYRKHGVMRDTPVGRTPQDGPPARNLTELVERIGDAPLLYQPGEAFEYSYSTTVLGAVIESVSGQRLNQFLDQNVFQPLDMSDTGFFVPDEDLNRFVTGYVASDDGIDVIEEVEESDYRDTSRLLDGGGAIAGTAQDYLNFATMLAQEGLYKDRQILSPKSVEEMFTPHVEINGLGSTATPFGYGVAIGTDESASLGLQPIGTVSWSGSGNTYFFVDPEHDLVALLMTHEIIPPPYTDRTAKLRKLINDAAIALAAEAE
ncbi:MAG: serine hydrolase domain-containing protein [Hyphomonas sp.]|uniref:serine hydrolase domain-containing protein n=1 Tax=Hyphomonas sp. TaxID=87 RepID=UPI0032642185